MSRRAHRACNEAIRPSGVEDDDWGSYACEVRRRRRLALGSPGRGLRVSRLVYDETPEPSARRRGAEVFEVEGQDGETVALGDRHHRCVGVAEAEIRVLCVDLDRASEEVGAHEYDEVLSGRHGGEERSGGCRGRPGAQELVGLDKHRLWDDKVAAKLGDQRGRKCMSTVPAIRGSEERARIGDDPHSARTGWRRYTLAILEQVPVPGQGAFLLQNPPGSGASRRSLPRSTV